MKLNEIRGHLRRAVPRPLTRAALAALEVVPAGRLLFALATGMLDGEVAATLRGVRRHADETDRAAPGPAARSALRRCVHRLEKGLIMRPRRPVFALAYIADAADLYAALVDHPLDADGVRLERWARQVLGAYFEAVSPHPVIDRARGTFEAARARVEVDDTEEPTRPYRRDQAPLAVDYDGLMELARRRRSVRWYRPEPVPRELLDQALQVALQAPSACNRQPFEFRFYDDPARVAQIASIPMGTTGLWENFPCVAVLVGQMSDFAHPRDRHVIYIDASLAAMGFAFALETLGLSSCCINWPDIPRLERRMRRALQLGTDEQIVMLMSIGWPDPEGEVPFSQKKALDAARSWNKP